jgi:hypothetical protein
MVSKTEVVVANLLDVDVIAIVEKKIALHKKELAAYFSNAEELDSFIDKTVVNGKNSIIGDHLTDPKLIKFYGYLGTNLIGTIADKILNANGLSDSERRSFWVNKILAPFQECISSSKNALHDADRCLSALTSSLVPSIGIGIVYELSRQNLSSSLPEDQKSNFNIQQTDFYRSCIKRTQANANDVQNCALQAMKNGILKITDPKLSKAIDGYASSPMASQVIKKTVWPTLDFCIQKIGPDPKTKVALKEQFMGCIDDLVKNTGAQLVQDKIKNNSSIKSNFTSAEVGKLVLEKTENFKACTDDQKKKNNRKDGIIDTSKCGDTITNEVTYKVVLKSLSQKAIDSFKKDPSIGLKIAGEGKHFLDLCWNNEQSEEERESCLRKTIYSFSDSIAANKLDKAIPNNLRIKQDLIQSSLKQLSTCFDKNLPQNISVASNLNEQIGSCSDKLTIDVAKKVAQESLRSKGLKLKMDELETSKLVSTYVDQKFMSCIGSKPTDEKIDSCSGELRKNAALAISSSEIRKKSIGKVSPIETENLVTTLVKQRLSTCLGNNPNDSKLDDCVGELTKKATKAIVLSYGKQQIKEQLNSDKTPSKLRPIEDAFTACTDRNYPTEKISEALDECTKNFALDFARTLGDIKLNSLLKSILGTEGYNDQKKSIDNILDKYNQCLDDLKKLKMEEGLLDKLSICTNGIQNRGINFVSSNLNTWMSSEQKDAATVMVKNKFSTIIPCLSSFLPPSPYSEDLNKNVDSVLKPAALLIAQYIEYSPENAKRTLEEIINELTTDLKDVASNLNSRKQLIDMLYKNGALDQFLKSMVRGEVKKSFETISESELPNDLRAFLLNKNNFDKIFSTKEGSAIKDIVMEKILKPMLLDQAKWGSPSMIAGMNFTKERIVKLLVYSPDFGDQLIKRGIQNKIDDMNGLTRFFAKALYGDNSLNWEKVRTTSKGKESEEFIRNNILLPKFKGQRSPAEEEAKINFEAERLVKAAVKNYE